ncbi:MAG: hypothetical protein JSW39_27960 [Desulfobacterales bacterium]|nr:MAG: hypothetical protein JSW39_27960 [Desulfobacterales bacterium]
MKWAKAVPIIFVLVMVCVYPVLAQCAKTVQDNGVIQGTLQQYFGTTQVSGEPEAVVDWCYYGGWNQIFLFLMVPCESDTKALSMMKEIGLAILNTCRTNHTSSKNLSPFEALVLEKGITVQMMRKGVPSDNDLLTVYTPPVTQPR